MINSLIILALSSVTDAHSFSRKPQTPSAPVPTHVPGTIAADWDAVPRGKEFTAATLRALDELGSELLAASPSDARTFCPAYSRLDKEKRKQVWLMIISSVTRYESSFNPDAKFSEPAPLRGVVSRGLLQLSVDSANQKAYGCSVTEKSLHDAEVNIRCGVRIMRNRVEKHGVIASGSGSDSRGLASYWSVLRTNRPSRESIISKTRALKICDLKTTSQSLSSP